ncbi:MAG: nitroreductase family protein [Oscillospiraceae bacterium]|nr:nitroreductase family protein [Oscillospiraceae bacterium]
MNAIFQRVSIRKWEDREVEEAKLTEVLRAAMQAPSAGNQRPWEFYIVKDRETLTALSAISKYSASLANAPVAIVNVCCPEGKRFAEVTPVDMSICTEHEWLQAAELGLGAVWIGVAPFEDRIQKANAILGLPEDRYVFSILPLGYPAETRAQQDRFDEARIHRI